LEAKADIKQEQVRDVMEKTLGKQPKPPDNRQVALASARTTQGPREINGSDGTGRVYNTSSSGSQKGNSGLEGAAIIVDPGFQTTE
jgi:hypothetical protein